MSQCSVLGAELPSRLPCVVSRLVMFLGARIKRLGRVSQERHRWEPSPIAQHTVRVALVAVAHSDDVALEARRHFQRNLAPLDGGAVGQYERTVRQLRSEHRHTHTHTHTDTHTHNQQTAAFVQNKQPQP